MEGKVSLLTGCPRDCGRFSPPQPRTSRKNRRLVTVSPAAAATLSERLRVFEQAKALTKVSLRNKVYKWTGVT
jgi:hypothetical protein